MLRRSALAKLESAVRGRGLARSRRSDVGRIEFAASALHRSSRRVRDGAAARDVRRSLRARSGQLGTPTHIGSSRELGSHPSGKIYNARHRSR